MQMKKKDFWTRYFFTFPVQSKRKVEKMDVRLVLTDCEGTVYMTDLMFQAGKMPAGYVPATREFLKRDRDQSEQIIQKRHYNGVIRGEKTIAIPNRAKVDEEKDWTQRVTGGIDFYLTATKAIGKEGVQFSHQYSQREMKLYIPLKANDQLEFSATKRQVNINGEPTIDFTGLFHTCPAGFGIFQVSLLDPIEKKRGAGKLCAEVDMWLKGVGGERM